MAAAHLLGADTTAGHAAILGRGPEGWIQGMIAIPVSTASVAGVLAVLPRAES